MQNINEVIFTITSLAVQKGISFPERAISSILNGKKLTEEIKFEEIKTKVLVYLKQKREADISKISEDLDYNLKEIVEALKVLKKEGQVKEKE